MYIKKILILIAVLGLAALGYFSYKIYNNIFNANTVFDSENVTIYIPTGATYSQVRDSLRPYLKDLASFDDVAQKKGYVSKVKPGKYVIEKNANNHRITDILRIGNKPVQVVFNNQERLENLAGRIATQIEADSVSLLNTMRDPEFLSQNEFKVENALAMYIPNQYEFFWNTSAEEFRTRMKKEYTRFWTAERLQKAEEIGLTPNEVAVVASIVQKETAKVDERPKVAGVYMNRLKNGWKLDADPTVIYALKLKNKDFDTIIKRVFYKDLTLDSPYNTYLYKELPPGPIAMPDISSIDAVLNYERHKYFYFVADVENFGYHKFAENLDQHNRNKQAYVRWINAQGVKR
ncbi:endolytic transglycosylase MltG [Antarcticibacterium arcticum]|uniref:Endolytic murein transglycosylase n=1 Tax=Antarcticibacterium arcticum TaxID=2585771 RepID=A0A5B8YGY2_9FLAO|nr:endolytic transglycosylase MltG [Antarcticibacterium arcticum]QED36368.1 endolytic transglycosylase MltG [Antarcticibacterium arcticum]